MPRIALDLNRPEDLKKVKAQWRVAQGLVPGEANEGLTAQLASSAPRLAEYDDSAWEVCTNIRKSRSQGFTFAWYRIKVEIPEEIDGVKLAGTRLYFETNIDNYGEVWVDGKIGRDGMVNGNNVQKRLELNRDVKPGDRHVIACLAANGPFGEPRGGVFMRSATLAFETAG